MTAVLWLRRDLRRHDLPALNAAAAVDGSVAVIFVVDPVLWEGAGPVRRAWLAANVLATRTSYDDRLAVRVGDPVEVLASFAAEHGADQVHVSSEPTPYGSRRDARVRERLAQDGIEWVETGSPYAVTPGRVLNGSGSDYKVFTPFAKAWQQHGWRAPAADVTDVTFVAGANEADTVLRGAMQDCLIPLPDAGEDAAHDRWETALDEVVADYKVERDRPDHPGTTRMSPYLKVGAIHPRTMLADLAHRRGESVHTLRLELAWREFYADVLHHNPHSAWADSRPALTGMDYDDPDPQVVTAWQNGQTGFPIVDAGMRQLNETGWMHNRVRMITASFFTKDLHLWWPHGARYFMERLIDGDIASNNHGWQWVSGTGTDAAPYFRVFNPTTQGKKFDPVGDYVRRWIPELRHLDGAAAHEPWKHDDGYAHGYPQPMVEHDVERKETLRRYDQVRARNTN